MQIKGFDWRRRFPSEDAWTCKACGLYEGTVIMEFPIGGNLAMCRMCAERTRSALKAAEKAYVNDPLRVRNVRPSGDANHATTVEPAREQAADAATFRPSHPVDAEQHRGDAPATMRDGGDPCATCGGPGEVLRWDGDCDGEPIVPCPTCHGTGRDAKEGK